MDKKDLTKGTRIYYTGDMANEEGLGVITRQITDRFGTVVDIRMDDKRFFPSISVIAFSDKYLGHGGTRFVTEEAYRDFRQDQIDKVEATLAQKDAERSEKKKPVTDDELDAMLVEASEEAEKRGESDKRELYEVWKDETSYGGLKWKVQMKHGVGSYKTKRAATESAEAWKKADAEAKSSPARVKKEARVRRIDENELQCKGCWNWNPESTWKRERTATNDYVLVCPNCNIWNKGDIETRPIKRSKTVSVQSLFKGRKR